ncbi:MAG: acyl-CoA dehydrogenase [Actinobacteria bacterium]|nr:acyl-CoA dehydrogenase [Actinomycetota bacterium]
MVGDRSESAAPAADLSAWLEAAEGFLEAHLERRRPQGSSVAGEGSDRVGLFHNLTVDEERDLIQRGRDWQRLKSDAGYGSITWPVEYGGAGLPGAYESAFRRLEQAFVTPRIHEAVSISVAIVAATVLALGTPEQKARYVPPLRRADDLCCQLFSEPGAGSDLGSVATRAIRDGSEWVITGQKVWTSGAAHADWGYVLVRTDTDAPRQRAMSTFIVPMRSAGVEVRPLRQMSGGSSFNEVFLTDVRVPDDARLGDVGAGWHAAMTTLGIERTTISVASSGGGTDLLGRLTSLARELGRDRDPQVRQGLADVYVLGRLRSLNGRRAAANSAAGGGPGPAGSIGKLLTTHRAARITEVVSMLLGPRLGADSGEWGTFAWAEFVTGVPGQRLAGGTDEIQRNAIAERGLGLPRESR